MQDIQVLQVSMEAIFTLKLSKICVIKSISSVQIEHIYLIHCSILVHPIVYFMPATSIFKINCNTQNLSSHSVNKLL